MRLEKPIRATVSVNTGVVPTPHARLHISLDDESQIRYRLEIDRQITEGRGKKLSHVLGERRAGGDSWSDLHAACNRLRELARRSGVVPSSIDQPIRSWAARGGNLILFVAPEDDALSSIPWELLPIGQRWPNAIVARTGPAVFHPVPRDPPAPVLLVAVWRHPGSPLPGMEREVAELPTRMQGTKLRVVTLVNPSQEELIRACREHEPCILHLATHELLQGPEGPTIEVAGAGSAPSDPVSIAGLCDGLRGCAGPRLVVLSIRDSSRAASLIASSLGVAAIGWLGPIEAMTAVDFSFLLYDRLVAGWTAMQAIREFARSVPFGDTGRRDGLAVAWLPDFRDFSLPAERRVESRMDAPPMSAAPLAPLHPPAISLEFHPVRVISHALLHSERPCIAQLSLDSASAARITLEVSCDTGAGVSLVRRTMAIPRGRKPLPEAEFSFPVLYELAARRLSRRAINFTVRVLSGDELLCEDTRSSLWLGSDEWLDCDDAWCFAPAYVQPLNPAVLQIVSTAAETLRILGGPAESFCAYQRPDATRRQMAALFQTLRRKEYALDYATPGPLVYTVGDKRPSGQRVRLPHEILRYRRATCYDLVLLVAACAEQIGLRPLIVLLPNHAVLGVWNSISAFEDYWATRAGSASSTFGEDWMLRDPVDLQSLLEGDAVVLVECVDITRGDRRFEDACAGRERQPWSSVVEEFQAAIDVHRARRFVPPVGCPE